MKIDKKFTRVFEDEDTIETWTYDPTKSTKGPINVDIKYKNNFDKGWVKRQNTAKKMAKIERKNNKNK